MTYAALDLGSNSFICLIYENQNGQVKVIEDKLVLTRLSEGVDQTKRISDSALQRAESAFKDFKTLFDKYSVVEVKAVATSAARDASNQKQLLDLAKKYNISIEIISGPEEARLTFMGVSSYFRNQSGWIIDIGGGSTEYILVDKGQLVDRVSLDIGVVRFTERYVKNNDFKSAEKNLRLAIKSEFEKNKKINIFRNFSQASLFLAVSGTPTTAVSFLLNAFDAQKIEQYVLKNSELSHLISDYGYLSLDQRLEMHPYIEAKRADVLPTGVLILQESLEYFNFNQYLVSTKGIRHGVAENYLHSSRVSTY